MEKCTKSLVLKSFLLCALFILTCPVSCKKKVSKIDYDEDEILNPIYDDFISLADDYLNNINFQGSVLVGSGTEVIFAKGYGFSDRKNKSYPKNTIQTTFETGSISKQITAAAIMQLVSKRKLNVNDKISKFFPDYAHGNEITVKMLLNMHSGLTDHINAGDEFFPKSVYRHIEKNQINNKPVDEDVVMTYFYEAPLMSTPDSTYFYCNTNYYLLAKIIEIVSGTSYQNYIKKNIFEPCGMKSANLEFQNTDSKGYDYRGRYYSIPASLAFGCGDLNASVIDLFKWNTRFAGGEVVNKKLLKEMLCESGYGYGVYCGKNMMFHGGTTNVFNSYNAYYFDDKVSVIVLVNRPIGDCNATIIASNLRKILLEE